MTIYDRTIIKSPSPTLLAYGYGLNEVGCLISFNL
jgi:hypothetical protein